MNDATSNLPAIPCLDPMDPAYLAATSFLAQYPNLGTRTGYARIIRDYYAWCAEHDLHPLRDIRRMHVAGYRGHLENERNLSAATVYQALTTVKLFYLSAMIDDHSDPKTTAGYDRRDRSPHGHPAMTLAGLYAAAA